MYQDPKNGFEEGQPLDKEGIERLTKLCIDKILEDRGPLMETVRMQVGNNFRCNFDSEVFSSNQYSRSFDKNTVNNFYFRYNMKRITHLTQK